MLLADRICVITGAASRRGIGRALLQHFIDEAREAGTSRVHLEVRDGNPAVAMYRRAGFKSVGRRRKYYHGRTGGRPALHTVERGLAEHRAACEVSDVARRSVWVACASQPDDSRAEQDRERQANQCQTTALT